MIKVKIVLLSRRGGLFQYSYGDWDYFALERQNWHNAIAALLIPTQGTLGRRKFNDIAELRQMLGVLIDQAKTAGIPCSLCAHAPAEYPSFVDRLIRCRITAISVEPEAVAATYQAIARAEQRLILEEVRRYEYFRTSLFRS